jgi:hypothetical protein
MMQHDVTNHRQSPAITSNHRQSPAITGNHRQSPAITCEPFGFAGFAFCLSVGYLE